jgi:multidrug resistance protein
MSRKTYFFLILILGSLTALGPFSIDMYLPGFPAIAKDLHTTAAKVSLSLSGFFIGISAGQLLYGPLLDRFGRKKPLFIGLCVYILASAGCAMAGSINELIVWRVIQAIGSCAATVASVAMVRDLFPVSDNAKVFSLLLLVVGVSPMIAPTVGGYVTAAFGWHAVFLILTGMGVAILAATAIWLPDSYKPDKSMSLKPRPIILNFLAVVKEPQFYTYSLTGAIAFAGLVRLRFRLAAGFHGSVPYRRESVRMDIRIPVHWFYRFKSVEYIVFAEIHQRADRQYGFDLPGDHWFHISGRCFKWASDAFNYGRISVFVFVLRRLYLPQCRSIVTRTIYQKCRQRLCPDGRFSNGYGYINIHRNQFI